MVLQCCGSMPSWHFNITCFWGMQAIPACWSKLHSKTLLDQHPKVRKQVKVWSLLKVDFLQWTPLCGQMKSTHLFLRVALPSILSASRSYAFNANVHSKHNSRCALPDMTLQAAPASMKIHLWILWLCLPCLPLSRSVPFAFHSYPILLTLLLAGNSKGIKSEWIPSACQGNTNIGL